MKVYILLILVFIVNVYGKSVDELINVVANNSMKVKYYFWVEESKAFLASKKNDNSYSVWHFTNDKKWQPIHNTGAFDGFDEAKKSFSNVRLDLENAKITFSSSINNDNKNIEDLVKVLENKTVNIKWYFWLVEKDAFLFSKDGEYDVRIWSFTNNRKWKPIHNASAYDGFDEAKTRLSDINFDHSNGMLSVGHVISEDDLVNAGFSNIPYLRANHNNYSNHDSSLNPKPTKNKEDKSIKWNIDAKTKNDAIKLESHIIFMGNKLIAGENPRAFDSLFLMEAYMKYNKKYTLSIKRTNNNILITKIANDSCAYEVISAHSDAVSGDFFGKGDIMNDYTLIANAILASSSCDKDRTSITAYISSKKHTMGRH